MKVIVGSYAMGRWLDGARKPHDIDLWVDYPITFSVEGHDVATIPIAILSLIPSVDGYATLDALYTIKASHLGWDINWQKHKSDILVMKREGAILLPELYNALLGHWKATHGDKDFLSLYKDKTEFFNDHVEYTHDHDYLHELVAHPETPIYLSCLKDGQDVAIDKSKWDMLSFENQVRMFKEEITVIACERWLLNKKTAGKIHWRQAYSYALRKTVTSLTKGWATEFIVLNMEHFVKPNYELFAHVFKTLREELNMATKVENNKELIEEIIEAYNSTGPKYPIENEHDLFLDTPAFEGFEELQQEGGGEGGAEYCFTVFKWKDKIYKITYSYASYEGYDFDYSEVYEVQPKEKLITVYM